MEFNRKEPRILEKISVCGENFQAAPNRSGANDEIRSCAREAMPPQLVVILGGNLIVFLAQEKVWIKTQIIPELAKSLVRLSAR